MVTNVKKITREAQQHSWASGRNGKLCFAPFVFFSFFKGLAMQLVGSWFPDQGLNPHP